MIRFGRSGYLDIRITEDHADEIGTFAEIFERVRAIPADYATLEEDPGTKPIAKPCRRTIANPTRAPFPVAH